MSYILDALKKSEQQRGTLDRPVSRPALISGNDNRKRHFGFSIIFVMAALLAGWFIAQWQQGPDKQKIESAAPISFKEVSVKQHSVDISQSETVESKSVEPIVVAQTMQPPAIADSRAPVIHVEEQPPVFTSVSPASPVSDMHAVPVSEGDVYSEIAANRAIRSLHELPIAVQQSMPEIKIEGHIYDVDPHARMVIINGKVRKEKHIIASGVMLKEITPDGVIISYQGDLFHIGVFD